MMLSPDLFSFAYVPNWYSQLDVLAEMALPEPWRFKNPIYLTKNPDTPILERYIHAIFKKQAIDYNDEQDPAAAAAYFHVENECACFHTGLYTRRYKAIYCCFERNKKRDSLLEWYFKGFSDELSPQLRYISPLPKKPSYTMTQYGVNYNPEWPIRVNVDHILGDEENLSRIPPEIREAQNLPLLLETAVELARRKADGRFTSCAHPFSGKLLCGECGGVYGSKVWHSNTPYRAVVWQCNEKHRGQHCATPHLYEEEIKAAFLAAFNLVLGNREEIVEAYREVMEALTDTTDLDTENARLQNELEVTMGLIRKAIDENAHQAMDQADYNRKYTDLCERYEKAQARLAELQAQRLERTAKRVKIKMFLEQLAARDTLVQTWDEELWYTTVDFVTVRENKEMVFTFRDGRQVAISAEIWQAA